MRTRAASSTPAWGVKGVPGLRVADASIMPADCRANTHFTCVMIGLMAASRIEAAEESVSETIRILQPIATEPHTILTAELPPGFAAA